MWVFQSAFFFQSQELMQKSQTIWAIQQSSQIEYHVSGDFLTLYPSASVDMRLKHSHYSKETSREWFHMDRRWTDKQRLFWANTNRNRAPWWPWETLPWEKAFSNLCHGGSQTVVQLSTCQRQAQTWLQRCSHCLLFPAVKFQQETCNITQMLSSQCFSHKQLLYLPRVLKD